MKRYFASPGKIIGYLAVAGIITLPVAAGFIMSATFAGIIVGMLLISIVLYPLVIKVCYPILAINEKYIEKRNFAGVSTRILKSSIKDLIVSVDYLAFRQDGRYDIMIDKGWFSTSQWENIVSDLQVDFRINASR